MKNSLRKSLATLGLSAAVILGAAGLAGAQTSTSTTSTKSTSSTSSTTGKTDKGGRGNHLSALVTAGTITQAQADAIHVAFDAARPAKGTAKPTTAPTDAERLAKRKAVLAPLVTAGTITQAQSDAVIAAMPVGGHGGHGDGGGGRDGKGGNGGFSAHAATVAKALGMTEAELKTQMDSGKTIAQIATAKGVSLDTIVNAYLVEEQAEHPEATAADLKARILDRLNGVKPARAAAGTSSTTSTTKVA